MRFAIVLTALALAGCTVQAQPVDDDSNAASSEQSVLSTQDLVPWGFTYLDFRTDETLVATLANKAVAPSSITIVSTDGKLTYEVPVVLKAHDPYKGIAVYVKASSAGPLLGRHLDCGDPRPNAPSGTVAPKGISAAYLTVVTFKWCVTRKPPNPPNCLPRY